MENRRRLTAESAELQQVPSPFSTGTVSFSLKCLLTSINLKKRSSPVDHRRWHIGTVQSEVRMEELQHSRVGKIPKYSLFLRFGAETPE